MEYTVWVGGGEINDYYLTKQEALDLADYYIEQGFDDVVIEQIDTIKPQDYNKQSMLKAIFTYFKHLGGLR